MTEQTYEQTLDAAKAAAKESKAHISILRYVDDETGASCYGYAPHGYVFGLFGPSAEVLGAVSPDGTFTPSA